MNPQQNPIENSAELPKPMQDQLPNAGTGQLGVEQQSVASELPQSGGMPPAVAQHVAQPLAAAVPMPSAPAPATATPGASAATNLSAEDSDLIEKEWVVRAKSIVAQAKDDPHKQTKDMSHFKAEYVKKRYNKELKVTEG